MSVAKNTRFELALGSPVKSGDYLSILLTEIHGRNSSRPLRP